MVSSTISSTDGLFLLDVVDLVEARVDRVDVDVVDCLVVDDVDKADAVSDMYLELNQQNYRSLSRSIIILQKYILRDLSRKIKLAMTRYQCFFLSLNRKPFFHFTYMYIKRRA